MGPALKDLIAQKAFVRKMLQQARESNDKSYDETVATLPSIATDDVISSVVVALRQVQNLKRPLEFVDIKRAQTLIDYLASMHLIIVAVSDAIPQGDTGG